MFALFLCSEVICNKDTFMMKLLVGMWWLRNCCCPAWEKDACGRGGERRGKAMIQWFGIRTIRKCKSTGRTQTKSACWQVAFGCYRFSITSSKLRIASLTQRLLTLLVHGPLRQSHEPWEPLLKNNVLNPWNGIRCITKEANYFEMQLLKYFKRNLWYITIRHL